MSGQLSEVSELQQCVRQELPTAINDVPPPPQLSSQHGINLPVTVQGTKFTVSPTVTGIHRPSLPPVTPRILEKIHKGEYIDCSTFTTKVMFGAPEPASQKPHSPLNSPLQVIHLQFNRPVAISELHPFLHG